MDLVTATNLDDPDGVYAAILAAHEGLSPEASQALNARLVLILANHAGDRAVIDAALDLAQRTG